MAARRKRRKDGSEREIMGAGSETEPVDLLIYGESLARGTEAMAGEEYADVLGIAGEAPGDRAGE